MKFLVSLVDHELEVLEPRRFARRAKLARGSPVGAAAATAATGSPSSLAELCQLLFLLRRSYCLTVLTQWPVYSYCCLPRSRTPRRRESLKECSRCSVCSPALLSRESKGVEGGRAEATTIPPGYSSSSSAAVAFPHPLLRRQSHSCFHERTGFYGPSLFIQLASRLARSLQK